LPYDEQIQVILDQVINFFFIWNILNKKTNNPLGKLNNNAKNYLLGLSRATT